MNNAEDLHEFLQAHRAAEPEVTEAAYRRSLSMYHPDVNKTSQAHDITVRPNAAYEVRHDLPSAPSMTDSVGSRTEYERNCEKERQVEQE